MTPFVFGKTARGIPIVAYRFTCPESGSDPDDAKGPEILVLGGVHGDESEGVICANGILGEFLADTEAGRAARARRIQLTLVPAFNLDGVIARTRVNGRGVDLNRNLPTKDWNPEAFNERYPPGPEANSEPENQALTAYLERVRPHFVLSLHSWKPLLNINGACEPEAHAIAARTGYTIEPSIGYPTPGCLGTYAGLERGMPTLTYEIERGQSTEEILRVHVPAVMDALRVAAQRK